MAWLSPQSQVPRGTAGAGKAVSVSVASLQHAAVWRPRPSWSSSEAWQVEHPAAFFLPGHWQLSDFKAGTR